MNKFLRGLLVGLMAFLLLGGGFALAAIYLHTTTVSVDITSGVKSVGVYSDAAATIDWASESIGLEQNLAWVETVYVKNDGSQPITVAFKTQGNTGFGMVLFSPVDPIDLAVGEVVPVEVTVYALPTATVGNYNFTIIVYE